MRAKVADLQLLASQEATEPRAMRALDPERWADPEWHDAPAAQEEQLVSDIEHDTMAAPLTGTNGVPDAPALEHPLLTDRELGDADTLAEHTLLLVPDGSDADAERQPPGRADWSPGRKPWAHLLQQWRPSLEPLRGLTRDRRKQTAIGGVALALVAIGVVALAQRGNAKQSSTAVAPSRAGAPIVHGEAGGALAHPAAAGLAYTPDTAGMVPAPTDSRDQLATPRGEADGPKATTNDARVAAPQLPPMQNIHLPSALSAVESSVARTMDSSLHAIAGSALTQVRGGHDRVSAFANPPPTPQGQTGGAAEDPLPAGSKPAVLAAGSPMPAYPPSLKPEGIDGEVVVEFVVDTAGHADASTLEVIRSDNRLFTAAVRKALPSMRFVPAESAGHKIQVRLQMPFRFTAGGR
jgi:TonB family protein